MTERLGLRGVGWWTLAFCMHRAAVLWWGFDGLFYWEETYRLLVAEALWQGWGWPILDLQADTYQGGSLGTSILATPMVALVGPSIIGLKLLALLVSTLGFVSWTILVDRIWGRRVAHLFAFLFVFGPPIFVIYNLIAMGSHAEVVTLGGLQLLLAYGYLHGPTRSHAILVAWGVTAGFGTWFAYLSFLPFAVCVAVGLAAGALPARRSAMLAAAFLIGFSPWIVTNILSGGRGLEIVARTFHAGPSASPRLPGSYWPMLDYLVKTGLPLGLRFPEVWHRLTGGTARRLLLAHVYFGFYALAWGSLLAGAAVTAWRHGTGGATRARAFARRPELPLLLLFPIFVTLLAGSDHVFLEAERAPFLPFRVLVPLLPPVMVVLAVWTTRLPTTWRWPVTIALALIGFAGTAKVLAAGASERPRLAATARALGAEAAGHLLFYKHGTDMALLIERITAMPDELRGPAFAGVGFSLAYHLPPSASVDRFVELLRQVPPAWRPDAVRGVRLALGPGMEQVKPVPPSERTQAMLAAANSLDPPKPDQ